MKQDKIMLVLLVVMVVVSGCTFKQLSTTPKVQDIGMLYRN